MRVHQLPDAEREVAINFLISVIDDKTVPRPLRARAWDVFKLLHAGRSPEQIERNRKRMARR